MVEAYRVGVTFALQNLVSAELLKMAGQFEAVDAAAKSFATTLKTVGGIGGAGVFSGVSASARAMGESFSYASAEIDGVRQKLSGLKQAASQGGGFWSTGTGGIVKSGLQVGAAYGVFESLKSGMSMEDTVARAMIALGMPVGPTYMGSSVADQLQNAIFDTSTGFGVSQRDTQDAALQAIRSLAPLSADQRTALLPSILKFAGAEVLGKHGTTMDEATEAGIALAHQLRAYTPEKIEPLLSAFAKLSMASPQTLSQMARSSSYYLPLLTAGLDMDPTELMALGVAGSQMGLNTKAGTWMRQMFQAPFTADLTSKRGSARKAALEALGLVGKDGKPVTRDAFEFLGILGEHARAMSPEERTRTFVAAFGQQGSGAASLYSDPTIMANVFALAKGLSTAKSPDELKKQYSNSPQVQFDQAVGQLMKTLTILGERVMPDVTEALKMLNFTLRAVSGLLKWGGTASSSPITSGVKSFLFGGTADVEPAVPNQSPLVIDHQTMLDGRVLAESTTKYQVQGLATAPASGSGFDGRMALLPVN